MNLPVDCSCKRENSNPGISLLEVVIAVGIFTTLSFSFVPLAIDFFQKQQFDVHLQGIVQTLRRAQFKSMSGESDSSFGVYFREHEYVLFKGSSYDTRDQLYDEIFALPSEAQVLGISEIVFSKVKGTPSDTGDIELRMGALSSVVTINNRGLISY